MVIASGVTATSVIPGSEIQFSYKTGDAEAMPFSPDWVEKDWGYEFLMDQTILDRRGDWYRLPPRPFPRPVWIHLPGREELSRVTSDRIYELSAKVKARRKGTARTVTLPQGNYFVVAVQDRYIEMRTEVPSDMPCGEDVPAPAKPLRTYIVDLNELCDADLHLLLKPAYTRGC